MFSARDVGHADGREAARHVADDRDSMAGEVESAADHDPGHERDETARHLRDEALQSEQQHERARPDRERGAARVPEVVDHMRELPERVAFPAFDPEQLRQLLDGDEDREPEDEPCDHRTRQELRDEPEPADAGEQEQPTHEQHQCGRVGQVVVVVQGEIAHGRGKENRRCRRPGHHHVTARPEDRIRSEGRKQRVQAGLRWQPGEPRVGDHLRDQQAPHGHARDDVEAEQAPVVVTGQPRRDRHETVERRRPRRRPGPRVDAAVHSRTRQRKPM